ncbi:hypothetical protein HanPSC8_Chr03g0088421 [Helianthus annuus]|nr:hypothetical protein HanPSC8_Chr03g0088421 [Helianthus annuus]
METQRLERKNHRVRWLTAAAPPATTLTTINFSGSPLSVTK